jgi:hypothetical protein
MSPKDRWKVRGWQRGNPSPLTMVETTMVETTMVETTMVETTMVETTMAETTMELWTEQSSSVSKTRVRHC